MKDLPPLTEAEIVAVLEALNRGEVTIPEEERAAAAQQYDGDFDFHLSNDWTFTVFRLCVERVEAGEIRLGGSWDCIHRVRAPHGQTLGFDELIKMPLVQAYEPPPGLWGIDR